MSDFRILIPEDELQARIKALGAQIRADHGDSTLTCICVLKGSFMFMADLVRAIGGNVHCEFLGVSSYHGGTQSTGVVKITKDLNDSIEGKDCLLIEDIVDTGLTLDYLTKLLEVRHPRSLKLVTLLDKPAHREVMLTPDYVGFQIPDEFVIGYGLDLGELYRNLPHIAIYTP